MRLSCLHTCTRSLFRFAGSESSSSNHGGVFSCANVRARPFRRLLGLIASLDISFINCNMCFALLLYV